MVFLNGPCRNRRLFRRAPLLLIFSGGLLNLHFRDQLLSELLDGINLESGPRALQGSERDARWCGRRVPRDLCEAAEPTVPDALEWHCGADATVQAGEQPRRRGALRQSLQLQRLELSVCDRLLVHRYLRLHLELLGPSPLLKRLLLALGGDLDLGGGGPQRRAGIARLNPRVHVVYLEDLGQAGEARGEALHGGPLRHRGAVHRAARGQGRRGGRAEARRIKGALIVRPRQFMW
mmetsp:Transcript_178753/g.567216  ORF Transcript_178753/g.567216 Transcript_178753/m.567216 type:complete len:235 (-) Transcript_178753:163-867(-)